MRWLVLVAVGALILALGNGFRSTLLSPGPLSSAHAEIEHCTTCHPGYDSGPAAWLMTALLPSHGSGVATPDTSADQMPEALGSESCLTCHEMGESAAFAHGLDPELLAARRGGPTRSTGPLLLGVSRLLLAPDPEEPIRCAACHREHHGDEIGLSAVPSDRCQICHSSTFSSFAEDHPQLEGYPAHRRTHLIFDHQAHIARHFPEARVATPPDACGDCHTPDVFGRVMLVRSFDTTCASCHLGQIDGSARMAGNTAIPVLVVPGLDTQTLQAEGFEVGEWPWLAEEEITPFMRLLLAGDPSLQRDLQTVEGLDLLDLGTADHDQLAATTRLAWAIKQLIFDVMTSGAGALEERLVPTIGQSLDRAAMVDLVGALPRDVVGAAQQDWFPDLLQEVSRLRAGLLDPIPTDRPSAKQADRPGRDIPAQAGESPPARPREHSSVDDELAAADSDLLLDGDDLLGEEDDLLAGGDDLLGEEDDLLTGEDSLLDSSDDLLTEPGSLLAGEDLEAATSAPEQLIELPQVDPEQWAALGGWYRRDLALYYRPVGHGDRFMRTWLDVLASAFGTRNERLARPLFQALTDRLAPGACAKCHSIDQRSDGSRTVNWTPTRTETAQRGFTTFAHATHFPSSGREGCMSCHALDPDAPYLSAFEQDDPRTFTPGFHQMEKELCAECHHSGAAGDACTQCHGYHVGQPGQSILGTRLSGAGVVR